MKEIGLWENIVNFFNQNLQFHDATISEISFDIVGKKCTLTLTDIYTYSLSTKKYLVSNQLVKLQMSNVNFTSSVPIISDIGYDIVEAELLTNALEISTPISSFTFSFDRLILFVFE